MTDSTSNGDEQQSDVETETTSKPRRSRSRRATSGTTAPAAEEPTAPTTDAAAQDAGDAVAQPAGDAAQDAAGDAPAKAAPKRAPRKPRTTKAKAAPAEQAPADAGTDTDTAPAEALSPAPGTATEQPQDAATDEAAPSAPKKRTRRASTAKKAPAKAATGADEAPAVAEQIATGDAPDTEQLAEVTPPEPEQPAESAPPKRTTRTRKSRAKTAAPTADIAAQDAPTAGVPAADVAAGEAPTGEAPAAEPAEPTAPGSEAPTDTEPSDGAPSVPAEGDTGEQPAPRARRRSRRATAPPRTPEQELDVIKELGSPDPTPGERVGVNDVEAADVDADEVTADSPETTDAVEDADATETEDTDPRLPAAALLFQAPDLSTSRPRRRAQSKAGAPAPKDDRPEPATEPDRPEPAEEQAATSEAATETAKDDEADTAGREQGQERTEDGGEGTSGSGGRRRRRRGGRGRRRSGDQGNGGDQDGSESTEDDSADQGAEQQPKQQKKSGSGEDTREADQDTRGADDTDQDGEESSTSRRRRRRRRSSGGGSDEAAGKTARDEVTALKGSTRLEAKRQRRREGRDAGRRRRDVITEAEFLARRESVNRKMVVREQDGLNQIAVLEDGLLVEHYVARHTQTSMVGNVYLGRVQNVLPSMEAAFIDLGKGRNAVLYAGEVNWDAAGMEGQPRRIEQAMKSGDQILVQVTKDPIGHKGARLTSQITLAGRYLVLVPSGAMTGISRKLPENERARLKKLLKEIVPEGSGVIVRTAAEGATEEQLRSDVERLTKQWDDIQAKAKSAKSAPVLLKGEPELAVRVVRDVFNEDFESLTVSGDQAWETISSYVRDLAPDLADRMHHWTSEKNVFAEHRIDEQLAKGMDRKVWLPSGGSLVIDRTEAMTVVDVNTGKFTGSGGTLEETVTRNNLEAAEEIVRQLRLRDIGGIIVIDFIDMVLESNRDLVMRRMVECLGRDRTRHQVAEVTSLGLVQMTRKRVGQGLVEAFSTTCECCNGRGFIVHTDPVEKDGSDDGGGGSAGGGGEDGGRRRGKRGGAPKEPKQPEPVAEPEDPEAAKAREAV
ncbi:Rne/Rng family ribonuclease, partial [Georgenia sp. 10Sc9-8]|nr:Rne/Rng family ribonuclease [Georgenia halotolerans]